ncbi:MAG: MOSC domain-containing protein, partial [Anaerolineales bacterium]
ISLRPIESRRNIATRGVALNHLVGRRFRLGEAVLLGIQLCEPCGYLEQKTGKAVRAGLVHRGGLRARVLEGGLIRPGDTIQVLDE